MPPDKTDSNAPNRQRIDHSRENAEDYVELIDDLQKELGAAHKSDIATRLGVSHVTVHKTIKRLKALDLVIAESYRAVSLTRKGAKLADESRKRHELVLRFLDHLGVPRKNAEQDAEGLEHHISPKTLKCIQNFCQTMENSGSYERKESKTD